MTYVYGKPSNDEAPLQSTDEEQSLMTSSAVLSDFSSRRLFARRFENQTCKLLNTENENDYMWAM